MSLDYLTGLSDKKDIFFNYVTLDKEEIGQKIIYIRNLNNLKQRELAKVLNTSPSTICAYEKGNTLILTAFLYQITKEFNVSMDWFVGASTRIKRI